MRNSDKKQHEQQQRVQMQNTAGMAQLSNPPNTSRLPGDLLQLLYVKQLSPSDAASSKQIKLPKNEVKGFLGDLRHKQRCMVVSGSTMLTAAYSAYWTAHDSRSCVYESSEQTDSSSAPLSLAWQRLVQRLHHVCTLQQRPPTIKWAMPTSRPFENNKKSDAARYTRTACAFLLAAVAVVQVVLDHRLACWEFLCTCYGCQYALSRVGK